MTNHTNTELKPVQTGLDGATDAIGGVSDVIGGVGSVTDLIPDFSALTGILVFFVCLIVAAGLIFYANWHGKQKKDYKYQLRWYKDYNGKLIERGFSKAKEVKMDGHILCLYIRDRKEIIPMPKFLSGDYVYNMIELPSGRYKNFTIPSLQKSDMKNGKPINIMEIDMDKTDLDYQNLVIKEELEESYRKKAMGIWEKYGQTISIILLVVIFGLAFYFLQSQMSAILEQISAVSQEQSKLLREINDLLRNVNAIEGRAVS